MTEDEIRARRVAAAEAICRTFPAERHADMCVALIEYGAREALDHVLLLIQQARESGETDLRELRWLGERVGELMPAPTPTEDPGYTTAEAQVLSPVLLSYREGVHDAVVIEGIERRCRFFEREIPTEAEIRKAITALLERGAIARNSKGWLVSKTPTETPK